MLLEDNSVLSSLTVCRKSYSYFKWKTQHNVTDRGVHAAKCVFTLWTVCTYFLVVVLDCPCMLFLQLEAGTWHDEVDWDSDIKKPLLSHDSLAVLQTWDSTSITRSCPCWNFLCRTNDESRGGGFEQLLWSQWVQQSEQKPIVLGCLRSGKTRQRGDFFFFRCSSCPVQEWCWSLWHCCCCCC